MTDAEDPRQAVARLHALALATLRGADASKARAHLDALADYAPDPIDLPPEDPRSDAALAAGVEPVAAARRFAARLRGVILGASAHADAVAREVCALAWATVKDEGVAAPLIEARARAAMNACREDLASDIVRLGSVAMRDGKDADAWVRRWGVVRSLELNGFTAAFTRDGTHAKATRSTSEGRDAVALRFAMAVAQAAMSLSRDEEVGGGLEEDVERTEAAITALLANVIAAGK